MKKLSLVLITVFLLGNLCHAQKDSVSEVKFDRFYISLSGGLSIPVGSFAKKEDKPKYIPNYSWPVDTLNMAGPAGTGVGGKLTAGYFFSKQFGCMAVLYANKFETKDKTLYEVVPYDPYYALEDWEYAYDAESWTTVGYMLGLTLRFPFNKSSFNMRFLAGSQHSELPETNILLTYNTDYGFSQTLDIKQLSSASSDFVWNAGMEYNLKLSRNIAVLCSADYTSSSSAEYEGNVLLTGKTYYNGVPGPYQDDHIEFYQHSKKISYISIAVGIAFVF